MTEMKCSEIIEALQELMKITMHEAINTMWNSSEEGLMKKFEMVMTTPEDENPPTLFDVMQMAGLIGSVLVLKYEKDENELMKMLKNSDCMFVKEILND